MTHTVGLDIGTTSVKAVAVDDDGTVVARARVPHRINTPMPGAFEHDVDVAWRANILDALAQVAAGLDVAAVNVAAMVPSLGAVRADGSAAGPGLLYGDARGGTGRDTRTPGDAGELLGFLAWLSANCPEADRFWNAQAVANHALCGRGAIDSTTAVTAYPLYDFVGWDEALAGGAGATPDQLPDVVSGVEPAGEILAGLPAAGALVGGGTIDALGEQLLAGADRDGDVLVIFGATLITWGVIPEERSVEGLWTIPHTVAGKCLVGGPSNAGGIFVDRARAWLGDPDLASVADATPADVPLWLPYVRGERTPLHRPDLRASLHGLAMHHTPGHLLRGAYEASAFVARRHIDLGREAGLDPQRIVATGGGTRAQAWMQAVADVTGLPVHVVPVAEGAALGSAFIARCVAGLESAMTDASRWTGTPTVIDPDPAWIGPCEDRYATFVELTLRSLSG